jgi:phosphopantetheinyl transferase (holo-ACP synthase)
VAIVGSSVQEVDIDEVVPLIDDPSVFTERERDDLAERPHPLPGFAARLAAKRAFREASGLDVALSDIGVVSDDRGRPSLEVADALADGLVVFVSLSHDGSLGVAVVIVERRD